MSSQKRSVLFYENEGVSGFQRGKMREQSDSEQRIGASYKEDHVMPLPATAPTPTVDVKVDDVVEDPVESSVKLSSAVKEGYKELTQAIKSLCLCMLFRFTGRWGHGAIL